MPSKITIETLLRDDDDATGASIRRWNIAIEGSTITLRHNHGDGFIMIRAADVQTLVNDLCRAQDLAGPYVIADTTPPKPPRKKRRTKAEIAADNEAEQLAQASGATKGSGPEIPSFLDRSKKAAE